MLIGYINNSQNNWEITGSKSQRDDNKNNIVVGNDNINIVEEWKREIKIEYD